MSHRIRHFPCTVCDKRVTRSHKYIRCDFCDKWCHFACQRSMTEAVFNNYHASEDFNWVCPPCELKNSRAPRASLDSTYTNLQAERMSTELALNVAEPGLGSPSHESTLLDTEIRDISHHELPSAIVDSAEEPMEIQIEEPIVHEESSFEETLPIPDPPTADEPEFVVIEKGTQRGKPMLLERGRFSYTVREKKRGVTYWRCSKRSCTATIKQDSETFIYLKRLHTHPAEENLLSVVKIVADIKTASVQDVFRASSAIVTERLHQAQTQVNLKAPVLLQRVVNRRREKERPRHPKTLDFELRLDVIPGDFLRHDCLVDGRRHLIFATQRQLDLLSRGKTWYVDGTFSCVRTPFVQLFSIHCFVRSGDCTKQLPLAFVLMSGRRQSDYTEVFLKVKALFNEDIKLKKIVMDFEIATWNACREVFPDAQLSGCYFHWTQAVWRKVQELGLSGSYRNDRGTNKLVRKLLCLPLLPEEFIHEQFGYLKEKAGEGPLKKLFHYVRRTWFKESTWDVPAWCVFRQPVRTNNDCEGWHNRLNRCISKKANLNMYELVRALHQEAETVQLQARLVSDRKLKKVQRKTYANYQRKLFAIWDEGLSAKEMLQRTCELVKAPDYV